MNETLSIEGHRILHRVYDRLREVLFLDPAYTAAYGALVDVYRVTSGATESEAELKYGY